jgi:hypothetical protein
MLKHGLVQKEAIIEVSCDKCGIVCKQGNCSPIGEFGQLTAHWGYDSEHDMQKYDLCVCEGCFFELIKDFKNKDFKESI